jgi:hypothetical protein
MLFYVYLSIKINILKKILLHLTKIFMKGKVEKLTICINKTTYL